MKRFLPLFVVAALIAVPAASARPAAPPTLQSGKLIVAFGDPAPGFASGTVRGNTVTNPRGYEVDLASAIAAKLGLKPVWMFSPWNSLFAPGTKKFDISFQEATITSQRKRTVDFTTSYLNANQGVLHLEADDRAEEPRRSEEAPDLRPDEHDGPRLDQDSAAPGEVAALVPDDDRGVSGGADQPLSGDDPRRAARVAAEEAEAGRVRPRRGPGRDARAVRRRPAEGLEAAHHGQHRHEGPRGRRDGRQAPEEVVQPRLLEDRGPEVEA